MSSAKKARELNRARTEHDNAKLSAQFAASNHTMLNIAESVLAKEIESIKQQLAECQATNGKLREALEFLWNIIDDIDTYSDMAKSDNSLFRTLVERRQADRWKTGITTDGYSLNIPALAMPNDAAALNELIAEAENRTAEACAKACIKEAVQIVIDGPEERAYNNATSDCAEAIRSGEWRKYK